MTESTNVQEVSTEPSIQTPLRDDKIQIQSLLAEARNTKEMLEHFRGAICGGTFDGGSMMAIAKGVAFLEAIMNQNKSHIKNLQERLEKNV